MASLTCVTCRIKFIGENDDIEKATELQRGHFQSDWHRYNLKRKTVDLPPISAEVFDEKVQLLENNSKQDEASEWYCKACSKKFTSQKTFDNHVISKKHLSMVKEHENIPDKKQTNMEELIEDDMDNMEVEELSDEEWESEPLPLEECLFCDHHSESLEKNMEHMTSKHSFFIPHIDCLVNLEGLMMYLGEKVGQFHVCLWCYCSKFYDVRAIKSHMVDKGHCMIKFDETNPEYAPFYNYDMLPQMFAKQKDELQVVLPSGAVLGHRDLFIYYKQRAKTGSEMAVYNGGSAVKHTKMIGWTGASGAEAVVKAKSMQLQERTRSRALLKVGVRANKLQRHFRDQVFGF